MSSDITFRVPTFIVSMVEDILEWLDRRDGYTLFFYALAALACMPILAVLVIGMYASSGFPAIIVTLVLALAVLVLIGFVNFCAMGDLWTAEEAFWFWIRSLIGLFIGTCFGFIEIFVFSLFF